MKRIIFIGRSECGKSTLTYAMKNQHFDQHKTQSVEYGDMVIDTPGEYAECKGLGHALALYSYESDVVGLLISATEQYSLFPPNIVSLATRPVVGIVTKCDHKDARPDLAKMWLENAGCKKIFFVSSFERTGIDDLIEYLSA